MPIDAPRGVLPSGTPVALAKDDASSEKRAPAPMPPLRFQSSDSAEPIDGPCADNPTGFGNGTDSSPAAGRQRGPRLTMLVSSADWRPHTVADQLPRLLRPLGIECVSAGDGEEAQRVIRSVTIHIAVIDLAIPLRAAAPQPIAGEHAGSGPSDPAGADSPNADARAAAHAATLRAAHAARAEAGARLLQLLRRLESPPPTIVIRPPQPSHRDSSRGLSDALREGAFAVLDRPIHLEAMLEALQRIVRRHYRNAWPSGPA